MSGQKQFLISVFDAMMIDKKDGSLISKSKTLIDSSIKQAVKTKEIRGGYGNQKQYEFSHDKEFDVELEDSVMRMEWIALNNGTKIQRLMTECFEFDEKVEIKGGKGKLKKTPISERIVIQYEDGNEVEVMSATGDITVNGVIDGFVYATYQIKEETDVIDIKADSFPEEVKLILKGLMDIPGQGKKEVQIIIERFKPKGNFTINAKADGVTSPKIDGTAFADAQNSYAKIVIKSLGEEKIKINQLACAEQLVNLTSADTKKALTFIGIRGGIYSNVQVPLTDLTLTSDKASVVKVNTDNTLAYVGVGEAVIEAKVKSNEAIKDYIKVVCS